MAHGYDNGLFRWWFDGVKKAGAKWDIIGMSHYPSANNWQSLNTEIGDNMKDMVSRFKKPVVIAEVFTSIYPKMVVKRKIISANYAN